MRWPVFLGPQLRLRAARLGQPLLLQLLLLLVELVPAALLLELGPALPGVLRVSHPVRQPSDLLHFIVLL